MKGLSPALLTRVLFPLRPWLQVAVALAAVLGHVFPLWLRLRGGKGVATALGVFFVLQPWAAVAGAVTYLLVLGAFRVSSVGSLAGALAALLTAILVPGPRAYVYFALGVVALLVFTHRGNLVRLWNRAERPR